MHRVTRRSPGHSRGRGEGVGDQRDINLGQRDVFGDGPVDGVVSHAHSGNAVADRHRPHLGSDRFDAADGVPAEPDRLVVGDQNQLVRSAG